MVEQEIQEEGWSPCVKCGGLFYERGTANVCPAGESHKSGSTGRHFTYVLTRKRTAGH